MIGFRREKQKCRMVSQAGVSMLRAKRSRECEIIAQEASWSPSTWRHCLLAPNTLSKSLLRTADWMAHRPSKAISHNTHIHSLSWTPLLCEILSTKRHCCYFLCLVIRSSLTSRSDFSSSCHFIVDLQWRRATLTLNQWAYHRRKGRFVSMSTDHQIYGISSFYNVD